MIVTDSTQNKEISKRDSTKELYLKQKLKIQSRTIKILQDC